MKYTFTVEDNDFTSFKMTQETDADSIYDVIDNFATFLKGVGFNYEGTLEIVDQEPAGLWTWSTSEPVNTVFDDVHQFMDGVSQELPVLPIPENSQAVLYKSLIKEEYEEWMEADEANDDVERIDACFDMIWVIIGYMKSRGWDCDAIWNEGAQSNLAKIDPSTGKVIRRPEDGKILKPEGWKPPEFKQFT